MAPSPVQPRSRRRRWRRRLLALVLIVGAFVGSFLIARPIVTRRIVLAQLASLTGGQADASRVSLGPDGVLTIEDGVIRAPGVEGEGGVVFRAARVEAVVVWRSLLAGNPVIRSVRLVRPMARLSQSMDDGSLNMVALSPRVKTTGGGAEVIPQIVIETGSIELGEHRTAPGEHGYTPLRSIPVAGQVMQSSDAAGGMTITVSELGPDGTPREGPGAMRITGRIANDEIALSLGDIALDAWPASQAPTAIRETYRLLALEGRVHNAEIAYGFDGSVRASADLAGVGVTLPVEVRPGEDAQGRPIEIPPEDKGKRLRMQQVNGKVTLTREGLVADLAGQIGGLPYEVSLRSEGQAADAAFSCTIRGKSVTVRERPEILKYAPGVVRRRMEQFSDPTGVLTAEVTVSRGAAGAGGPAPVKVNGRISFRNTTAAFERFPYRFYNLNGEVEFDDEKVVLKRIEGDAPGGVRLIATGEIAPPSDDAKVDIQVHVTGLPVDRTLREAMSQRGRIIEEMFSLPAYERLVKEGLIARTPEEATPAMPYFKLGGSAVVKAHIWRDEGPGDDNWHDKVTISLAEVGVLPDRVQYPLIARDVTIVKDDAVAVVQGGTYRGLRGGAAKVGAKADIDSLADPNAVFAPEIEIDAVDVPIDPLLIASIPAEALIDERPVREVLAALKPDGVGRLRAKVGKGPPGIDIDYRVEFETTSLTMVPGGPEGKPGAELRGGQATVEVTPLTVDVDLQGEVTPAGGTRGSPCTLTAEVRRDGPNDPARALVKAGLSGLDVTTTVEDLIRPFTPRGATELGELREKWKPEGRTDAAVEVRVGESTDVISRLSSLRDASILASGGRLAATSERGTITVIKRGEAVERAVFEDFVAAMRFNGADDGVLRAHGGCTPAGGPAGGPVHVSLTGGRFESPVIRFVVGEAAPARLGAFFRDADLRGRFDFETVMTPDGDRWSARGAVVPRSMVARFGETDVTFPTSEGRIEFEPGQGRLKGISLRAPTWGVTAEGSWLTGKDGSIALHATATLDAQSLTPDLRAVVPKGLRDVMDELAVKC